MSRSISDKALNIGKGILRLAPSWVPRSFCRPGRRIKLHPKDIYHLGTERGGIDERWLSSTTPAENGPGTPFDEGLSYVITDTAGKEKVTLRDTIEYFKSEIIGEALWSTYRRLPVYSKFFDNLGPLPHHIHHRDEHAKLVGLSGKPEMYFFPAQYNNYPGEFAFTFFGLKPEVTKDQVKDALMNFDKGDNRIIELSRSYKLQIDTGWDVPPGVLHAPGSLCTYEPQFASDVYAMYQSVLLHDHTVPKELLWKNCPEDKYGDFDYLLEIIDWELNVDSNFSAHRFMNPIPVDNQDQIAESGYCEELICYKSDKIGASRLTILPGRTATYITDHAFGLISLEGYGRIGEYPLETPTLIRYNQATYDEFYVTESAAKEGVIIQNFSNVEPIVLLCHYAICAKPVLTF